MLIASIKGNEWVAKYYEKKSYRLVATIQADNLNAAIAIAKSDNPRV